MPKRKSSNLVRNITILLIVLSCVVGICLKFGIGFPQISDWFSNLTSANELVPGEVRIHQIDIGQGDSTLIQTAQSTILIDAGDNGYGDTVVRYLRSHKVKTLDLVIATHPHADHIGGMREVLEEFEVKRIMMPELPASLTPTSKTYERLLSTIATKGMFLEKADPGSVLELPDCSVEIIAPVGKYGDLNNYSIAGRLISGEFRYFFGGDIEAAAEQDILEQGVDLSADVEKISHHGSSTSNTEAFLDAIGAKIALISVGVDNSYGHPAGEVLSRLEKRGMEVYRTDRSGNIVVTYRNGEITVNTYR